MTVRTIRAPTNHAPTTSRRRTAGNKRTPPMSRASYAGQVTSRCGLCSNLVTVSERGCVRVTSGHTLSLRREWGTGAGQRGAGGDPMGRSTPVRPGDQRATRSTHWDAQPWIPRRPMGAAQLDGWRARGGDLPQHTPVRPPFGSCDVPPRRRNPDTISRVTLEGCRQEPVDVLIEETQSGVFYPDVCSTRGG